MEDFNNRPENNAADNNANVNGGQSPNNNYSGYNPTPPQQPYPPNYYGGQSGSYNAQPGSYNAQPTPPPQQEEAYRWNFENMHRTAATPPPKKKHRGARVFGMIAAALALVMVGSFACYGVYVAATGDTLQGMLQLAPADGTPGSASSTAPLPEFSVNDKPAGTPLVSDAGMSNSEIFKKVSPTVVGIVSYVAGNPYMGGGGQSQGSGIIMSADGYIITNAHVVSGADSVEVVLADGKSYEATLVGMDIPTDLAVIKIEATGLTPAEFGNSDQMEVGERVVAIGNPGGLQFASSLTVGYVSALNRSLSSDGEAGYELDCIQTDAAINPGNSGGALINAYGQVVGINSAKIKATGFEGMGFAIPINDAMPIINDMIQNGKVTGRAMLGITAEQVTAAEAQYTGGPMGLRIREFAAGTDMERKGAQVGDIVTHINNTPVYSTTGSAAVLKEFKPGDTVTVSLYRVTNRGKAMTYNIEVTLIGS